MTSALTYAAVVSLILAVARDVPILHLFAAPDVEVNEFPVAGLGFLVMVLAVFGWGVFVSQRRYVV